MDCALSQQPGTSFSQAIPGDKAQNIIPRLVTTPMQSSDPEEIKIALSEHFWVSFYRLQRPDIPLTYYDGADLGLSAQEVWHRSSDNVLRQLRTGLGFPIQVRCAGALTGTMSAGLHIRTEEIPVTSMCTHPALFKVLHRHVCQLMRQYAYYFYWEPDSLMAIPHPDIDPGMRWMQRHYPHGKLFAFQSGYPATASLPKPHIIADFSTGFAIEPSALSI